MPAVARCPLCRADVAFGDGTLLKAGRRPLALVHRNCATVAQQGVALMGKLALMGASQVLTARAPHAMLAFKAVHQMFRKPPPTSL